MSDVKGAPAIVTFTLTITRKETGAVEHYQMEGFELSEPPIEEVDSKGEPECPQQ